MDILVRIKRLVLQQKVIFTRKAREEMDLDGLWDEDVIEAIVNAPRIDKTLRSRSRFRLAAREKLYVIKGWTYDNLMIYTKGTIRSEGGEEAFYVLISSKRAD